MLAAHQYLQTRTCINFVQSSTATNRVKVNIGFGWESKESFRSIMGQDASPMLEWPAENRNCLLEMAVKW